MNTTTVNFAFPDLDEPAAHGRARDLFEELTQDPELRGQLDLGHTKVQRTDREGLDFGVTLIAVLGTPAVIILARAVKAWAERKEVSSLDVNGVHLKNVRSQDVAAIVKALQSGQGSDRK